MSNLNFETFYFYLISIIFTYNNFYFLKIEIIIVTFKIIKDSFNYMCIAIQIHQELNNTY